MVSRTRVGALVALLGATGAVRARSVDAHPLHSSFAEVTRDRTGAIVIQVRLFADDFGALLDSLRASSGGQSQEFVARQYVQRQLVIAADQSPIATEWCGMRSEQNVTWVCVRTARPITGAFRIRNALMFDRFSDQISIIRWVGKRQTRTLVLSGRLPEARLE